VPSQMRVVAAATKLRHSSGSANGRAGGIAAVPSIAPRHSTPAPTPSAAANLLMVSPAMGPKLAPVPRYGVKAPPATFAGASHLR
jgi:hypothetical protein